MTRIAIIGWYGTETIGDRAILSGLISLFSEVYKDFEIKLGSLYPTLSQRTIFEDYPFYCTSAGGKTIPISIFDTTTISELKSAIKWADMLVMGGGPLMDIDPMYMVEYAFKYAKKKDKKTAILGCGIGPLIQQKFIKSTLSIIKNSDITIFRDNRSLTLYHEFIKRESSNCLASIDPAVFAADIFNELHKNDEKNSKIISINFRESDGNYNLGLSIDQTVRLFSNLLKDLANKYSYEILLVPMHTFRIGGDDRYFLNQLARNVDLPTINVQNIPLSLEETMNVYSNSVFCIGMRFHSILLQTILNGKNYIFDYTDINNGKIINLLHQLQAYEFYKNRYYSLMQPDENIFMPEENIPQYRVDNNKIYNFRKIYIENLNNSI
jgi:polysaccharide pyruvyl transferase WcaK-like protein